MRAKIILNPGSGAGKVMALHPLIYDLANDFGRCDTFMTERRGHATELARAAAGEGYELVIAVGGDGTVHEVINGLVEGDRAALPLGVLPFGTGNDFAWGLGLPHDPDAAIRRVFEGTARTVDLARVEDDRGRREIFQNNFGAGFDAMVVVRSESLRRIKGFAMYLTATLQTILFDYDLATLDIDFDDEHVRQRSLFLALGNGPRGGGGFLMVPDAEFDDGKIDSCLVNPVGRATMLYMLTKVMKGTHVHTKYVTMRQNRCIAIHSDLPMPIHLDGEMFAYPKDDVHAVTISTLPRALDVIC